MIGLFFNAVANEYQILDSENFKEEEQATFEKEETELVSKKVF